MAPGNGFRHASSRARFQASGSARSQRWPWCSHSTTAPCSISVPSAQPCSVRYAGRAGCTGSLRCGFEGMAALELLDRASIASRSSSFAGRAELCPPFGVNTPPAAFQARARSVEERQQGSERYRVNGEADPGGPGPVSSGTPQRVIDAVNKRFGADRKMQDRMLAHFLVAWPAAKKEKTKKT